MNNKSGNNPRSKMEKAIFKPNNAALDKTMNKTIDKRVQTMGESGEIECLRLLTDGSGIGYLNGIATFIPGMLPGEVGEVTICEAKKKWQRASLRKITRPSPKRVEPPCPVFGCCGGCQLQHTTYQETLNWKQRWVADALSRIGKITIEVKPTIGMNTPWRYRNKVRLHRDSDGRIGYFKEKSQELVVFRDCLLLSTSMNHWIRLTEKFLAGRYPEIHSLTYRENTQHEGILLLEGTPAKLPSPVDSPEFFQALAGEGMRSVWGTNEKGAGFLIWGAEEFRQTILDMTFQVSPLSFLQVNSEQTELLYRLVLDAAELTGEEIVWDLYTGIGTLALALAQKARKVTGIEENPFAVQNALQNAVNIQTVGHVEFLLGKVEHQMMKIAERPDVVVVDPPRAGMQPEVIKRLIELKPKRIIYVSCDPGTLARDLALLTQGGYGVKSVQPVDMFCWTQHCEAVALVVRE